MASPLAAASAYANIARLAIDPSQALGNVTGAGAEGGKSEGSFATMLKDAIGAVNEAGRKSDAQTKAMVNGKSNMVDVVTAVAETEVAVSAVVAVRDKVIQAYDEIMKMPI
jgi:flagellar hook-basal body complex protein FliE